MTARTLLVVSAEDPVAVRAAEHWGTPPSTGMFVEGAPLRALGPDLWTLRRPGRHIFDDGLDGRLPDSVRAEGVVLIFPSIHRSESGTECFTVHPLGNPGASAEVGGAPHRLVPTAPRRMTDALRRLSEAGGPIGLEATFEATHHGPLLESPAFFAEIGFGEAEAPSAPSVAVLARVLTELGDDPTDRIAVGVGGGHYAPHFGDLARRRRWAFGHLLSRHAIEAGSHELLRGAISATPGAEGVLFARASDAADPRWSGAAARLRDNDAPRRGALTP